jgi:hypothetical protein
VTVALFPERYACPTCHGDDTVPADPEDPGNGWRRPCPTCPRGDVHPVTEIWYDPEHADIPY